MRTLTSVLSIVALTFSLSCSSGGDDDPVITADAAPSFDSTPAPDSMPVNPAVTSGLGQVCDATTMCAVPATNSCLTFNGNMTTGLCTPLCAGNLAAGVQPEAPASMACATGYTGTTGTPVCAASVGQAVGTNLDWYCLIGCGDIDGTDFGGCPAGLTCTNNACTP